MTDTRVLELMTQALTLAAKLAGPILLASLVVGTVVSLLQAVTQVQEMTLSFVPKLAAIAVTFALAGNWMLRSLSDFMVVLYSSIPQLLR